MLNNLFGTIFQLFNLVLDINYENIIFASLIEKCW